MALSTEKQEFSARLNLVFDDMKIPPKGKGRQEAVGKMFGVGQKGARKWLEGESIPTYERCVEICRRGNVHYEWLMTGRGPRHIAGGAAEQWIEELPDPLVQETFDFWEVRGRRMFEGDTLAHYLRWIDTIRKKRPGPGGQ